MSYTSHDVKPSAEIEQNEKITWFCGVQKTSVPSLLSLSCIAALSVAEHKLLGDLCYKRFSYQ